MYQSQSLPEKSKDDSPTESITPSNIDSITLKPHDDSDDEDYENIRRNDFKNFATHRSSYKRAIDEFDNTPPRSPYARRVHPTEKRKLRTDYDNHENNNKWTPNDSDNDSNFENERQDVFLPVEMVRRPSLQSLRIRRDQQYQGIRTPKSRRVVNKGGDRNISVLHIPERSVRFFKDFVTTLIDEQWRYTLTVFALSFFLCWIFFAILWFLIAHAHGDLNFDEKTGERLGDGREPCVHGAKTFSGFLLFSIETQVSIGFGEKYPSEECPEAVFMMVVQIVIGIAIEGAMVGIVYAKMVRPPKKSFDLMFSKKAVVCQRDGKLCLIFRVCDIKQCHIIGTHITAYWFDERRSLEGERLQRFQYSLKLENNGKAFVIWPITVSHVIDSTSPLYDLSAKDLLEKRFEIVLTITGTSRSTGQVTQARTSYLPREVNWGHRFVNVLNYDRRKEKYVIDYSLFDATQAIDTALCSARRLDEVIDQFTNSTVEAHDYQYADLNHIYPGNEIVLESRTDGSSSDDDYPFDSASLAGNKRADSQIGRFNVEAVENCDNLKNVDCGVTISVHNEDNVSEKIL